MMESTIEDAIYLQRDFIRDNYNTYLSSINNTKGDSVKVQDVKTTNIEIADVDPFSHTEYPIIDLYPTDIIVGYLSAGSDEMRIDYTALIAINRGNESYSTMKLSRYAEALRGILRDYKSLGSSEWDMDPEAEVSIAIYPSHETELKVATVQWRVILEINS